MSTKTTVTVEEETWRALAQIKLNKGFASMDDVVKYLLSIKLTMEAKKLA